MKIHDTTTKSNNNCSLGLLTSFCLLFAQLCILPIRTVIDERLYETGRAVLGALLVYNDILAHEVEEASGVGVRVTCRDLGTITHVQPDLDMVLSLFFEVVRLEVVDDGKVVDVSATGGDVAMLVPVVLFLEVPDQLLGV